MHTAQIGCGCYEYEDGLQSGSAQGWRCCTGWQWPAAQGTGQTARCAIIAAPLTQTKDEQRNVDCSGGGTSDEASRNCSKRHANQLRVHAGCNGICKGYIIPIYERNPDGTVRY